MDQPMRILIADDDRHARAGLRALLGTYPACEIVGEAVNGQDVLEQIERCRPDAVLLDVWMPVLDGIQASRIIKTLHTLRAWSGPDVGATSGDSAA
jgi:YesN/AraC family two-component response regulator